MNARRPIQTYSELRDRVVDAGLCTRCGNCVGLSSGAIKFEDELGECLPRAKVPSLARDNEYFDSCSGEYVPFPKLNQLVFGRQPRNLLLGCYRSRYIAYSTDPQIRRNAASAGVLTTTLSHLLETGRIDGAITLGVDPQRPYKPLIRVARTTEEIAACAQSKYVISPINQIIDVLQEEDGRFALVGLPCQIHALRKLELQGHPLSRKLCFLLGPYTGNQMHFDSLRSFLSRHGVKDLARVSSVQYRAGEWPGRLEVQLTDGKVLSVHKFYANYLTPFFIMRRCLYCIDLTNEFTDISVGDAWAPEYERRGEGWSVVLGRTDQGAAVVEEMKEAGKIRVLEVSEEKIINTHSHGLDLKKRGAFIRIARAKRRGLPTPEYDLELVAGVSWARLLQETALGFILRVCWTRAARLVIEYLPLWLVGPAFVQFRSLWKSVSKSTKRSGITRIRYRVTDPDLGPIELSAEADGDR